MTYVDLRELNDLTTLAAKGGLGKGTATSDCVAEEPDQLMFITGDELILLRELDEVVLASCEGVVGWVKKGLVTFDTNPGTPDDQSTPKTSLDASRDELPRTMVIAPSPSPPPHNLPLPPEPEDRLDAPAESKRVSGPFELESPQQSPNIDGQDGFAVQQASPPREEEAVNRESMFSVASSEMYGGIGGFMMGNESTSEEGHEMLSDDQHASVETPFTQHSGSVSPQTDVKVISASAKTSPQGSQEDVEDEDWDIYDQYARESMYAPLKRYSLAAKRASKMDKAAAERQSMAAFDAVGAVNAARAALEGGKTEETVPEAPLDPETPKQNGRVPMPSSTGFRSVATELRLKIQREREAVIEPTPRNSSLPPRKSSIALDEVEPPKPRTSESSEAAEPAASPIDPTGIQPISVEAEEAKDLTLDTPEAAQTVTFTSPSPETETVPLEKESSAEDDNNMLASPVSLNETPKLEAAADIKPPEEIELPQQRAVSPMFQHSLVPPPPSHSPNPLQKLVHAPWSPDSPASPHSITATRQAVEAVRSTPEGSRGRAMTLVGMIDSDLRVARGPVPITFVVGGSDMAATQSAPSFRGGLGLGLPSPRSNGRTSPITPDGRARSPLGTPIPPPPMPDDIETIRQQPSRFPNPQRSFTSPVAPEPIVKENDTSYGPRPGFFAARPRSRSFGAAMAKAVGRAKKETPPTISTATLPSMPSVKSPSSPGSTKKRLLGSRKSSLTPGPGDPGPPSPVPTSHRSTPTTPATSRPEDFSPSLPLDSGRSSSFSFASKGIKTPRKASRPLPSPVSHKDFEDTVNAGGMDFELVQPRKNSALSPQSKTTGVGSPEEAEKSTLASASSSTSLARAALPETDEWGFVKDRTVTPEIYQSRSAPIDHRAAETRWLAMTSSPVMPGSQSKKARRYAVDIGIPSSLRGKVWAWFMTGSTPGRVPGLYQELADSAAPDPQIEQDIQRLWSDHSLFCQPSFPGSQDLQSVLRAYTKHGQYNYSTPMCHLAATMLIHSVAEDAFWLLSGIMNTVLSEYYSDRGLRVDAAVFDVVLRGSEKALASAFKSAGIKSPEFLTKWYKQLFIRCLPWPTALRVIDTVVSEGPRYLLIASLTILTLSRERLLAIPQNKESLLGYLNDLPQDSLLLPENFMKAMERVKFKDEDWKRLRSSVEKDLGLGAIQSPVPTA